MSSTTLHKRSALRAAAATGRFTKIHWWRRYEDLLRHQGRIEGTFDRDFDRFCASGAGQRAVRPRALTVTRWGARPPGSAAPCAATKPSLRRRQRRAARAGTRRGVR